MKKALFALLALAPLGAAAAQAPQPPAALQPGEVLLQIAASGGDVRPADDIVAKLFVRGFGANPAEARSALDGNVEALASALAKAGIDRKEMTFGPAITPTPAPVIHPVPLAPDRPAPPPPTLASTENVTVRVTSAAQLRTLQNTADAQGITVVGAPIATLQDDRAAREAATAQGIAKARRSAEIQASLLGMHIVRVLRVSNYGPMGDLDPLTSPFVQMMRAQLGDDGTATTAVRVYIDFAMAPGK